MEGGVGKEELWVAWGGWEDECGMEGDIWEEEWHGVEGKRSAGWNRVKGKRSEG